MTFFLRTEIDNPSLNFTGNAMHCVASVSYQETCTFMSYGSMNAQISCRKATDWSGSKVGKSSKKTERSWYQSIGKKHI
jgi:hypothetical protein